LRRASGAATYAASITTTHTLLRIRMFEPLRVQYGDRPPIDEHFPRRKAKALFVYLYLNRGRHISKYQLLADLWPHAENGDPDRVKHTVQVLRAALEGPRSPDGWRIIKEREGSYFFNPGAERYCDAEEFEKQFLQARSARDAGNQELALRHYRACIELHTGTFLADFLYEDWAAVDIARYNELYLQALEEGAQMEASVGNFERAITLVRQATVEDPLHESSYVELMRYFCIDGRRTEALRTYYRLREVLAKRLEVEPQVQTTRLFEAIRHDQSVAA
jgi:DNA-binding SARP family transcriptional activator